MSTGTSMSTGLRPLASRPRTACRAEAKPAAAKPAEAKAAAPKPAEAKATAKPAEARAQEVAAPKPLPKSLLLLDKPQRLWEAGSTLWFHGYEAPDYLDGSLAGDAGFDPLNLVEVQAGSAGFSGVADDPEKNLLWLAEGELWNGRVAMLGVVGILGQELLGLAPWWELVGKANLAPAIGFSDKRYLAVVFVAHLLYGKFEVDRFKAFKANNVSTNFDPLNLRSDRNRQAEVRNGRLAMLAAAGFAAQAIITGRTPLENLNDHIAEPLQNNILTQGSAGWYLEGAFLVFSVAINLIGFAKSRKDAQVRTLFSEFSS